MFRNIFVASWLVRRLQPLRFARRNLVRVLRVGIGVRHKRRRHDVRVLKTRSQLGDEIRTIR